MIELFQLILGVLASLFKSRARAGSGKSGRAPVSGTVIDKAAQLGQVVDTTAGIAAAITGAD